MEYVRKISELILHLRILSTNLVEAFLKWRERLKYNDLKLYEWIHKDLNYLMKMQIDHKFIK